MADYQLNQNGPTVQQAIDKALEIEQELQQEASAREQADALLATKTELAAEAEARAAADALKASSSALTSEVERAQGVEGALSGRITTVENKIPSAASPSNQLADKAFVNTGLGQKANASDLTTLEAKVPSGASPSNKLVTQSDIANFITRSVNDLANYYLKNETYNKTEVNNLIGAIDQFHYEIYASTSAITSPASNVLYLIGPTGSGSDKYEEYVYASGNFVKIGDTSIDLSGYVTTTALNTALANYTTTADLTTLLAAKYEKPSGGIPKTDLAEGVQTGIDNSDRMARDFGRYDNPVNVTLVRAISGKYVDKDTALEVANANYGISEPVSLAMGDILLVPSASAVLAACSVVSRKVTNTYNKPVVYTYTYDDLDRIATAKADYDATLVYTAHYASDEASMPDYWTIGGSTVESLPSTHEVTNSFYEPLVKQSVAAMPSEGYYVFLASETMEVVISGLTATVNGGVAVKVGWGIFKNISSNFVGGGKQRVIAEAIAMLFEQVDGINNRLAEGLPHLRVDNLEIGNGIWGILADGTTTLKGEGAPSASVAPKNWVADRYGAWQGIALFPGQHYHDTTNKVIYEAIDTTAVTDWLRISNA